MARHWVPPPGRTTHFDAFSTHCAAAGGCLVMAFVVGATHRPLEEGMLVTVAWRSDGPGVAPLAFEGD